MKKNNQTRSDSQDPNRSRGLLNILKVIILIVVLVGAWFILDWLISGK